MNQPQWQLAKILKKEDIDSIVYDKLVWVKTKEPQVTLARHAQTGTFMEPIKMYATQIFDQWSIDQEAGVATSSVELYPIFASAVGIFSNWDSWLKADNKVTFNMGQLTEELTYEDFERVFSH